MVLWLTKFLCRPQPDRKIYVSSKLLKVTETKKTQGTLAFKKVFCNYQKTRKKNTGVPTKKLLQGGPRKEL